MKLGRPQKTLTQKEKEQILFLYDKYKDSKKPKQMIAENLGLKTRTLHNLIKKTPELKHLIKSYDNGVDRDKIKKLLNIGISPVNLSKKFNVDVKRVYDLVDTKKSKKLRELKKQLGENMLLEITEQNRLYLAEISDKLMNNKIDELSDELLVYAKILYQNGFITKKGEVTQEGKDALYH
jgi:hypothetical protein